MKTYVLTFETEDDNIDLKSPDYFYLQALPEVDILGEAFRDSVDIEGTVLDFKEKVEV